MNAEVSAIRVRVGGIMVQDSKILLIAHKKNGKIYWLPPGGGVSAGESLDEALMREFSEELNLEIEVNNLFCVSDSIDPESGRHILNILFCCSCADSMEIKLGKENRLHRYNFFDKNELQGIVLFPPVAEELTSLLSGYCLPAVYKGKSWTKI